MFRFLVNFFPFWNYSVPHSFLLFCSCSVIPPLANSDHFGLLLDIKWKTNTKQARSEKRKIWRYAHADFQKACQLIDSTDWDSILYHDVDQSILQWNNCFLNIMEQCIPKATLGRRRNLPWLTKNIASAIRKRNYLFNRAKSSGRRDHVEKYKRMRNRVTTMLRNGKKLFFPVHRVRSNCTLDDSRYC